MPNQPEFLQHEMDKMTKKKNELDGLPCPHCGRSQCYCGVASQAHDEPKDPIAELEFQISKLTIEKEDNRQLAADWEEWSKAHRDETVMVMKDVMSWIKNWSPDFTDDPEWPETEEKFNNILSKLETE